MQGAIESPQIKSNSNTGKLEYLWDIWVFEPFIFYILGMLISTCPLDIESAQKKSVNGENI